jgi:hypothetical protein
MAQRKVRDLPADKLWKDWRSDIDEIKQDTYELFSSRRTFRDVAAVFRGNPRLQEVGGHLWDWMRISYASYVVMRVRRETDEQGNTVNLNQLLAEIEARPEVITRARYFAMLALPPGHFLLESNERYFTDEWTGPSSRPSPGNPGADYVDPPRIRDDRDSLQAAVERVKEIGNRQVAHRTRVEVKDLTFPELDATFDAIEKTLKKYYTLLHGATLMQAEPAPQFNTHAVFTFPWIDPEKS